MKENKLTIRINRSIHEVFKFTITPPNSTRWIPSVIKEEINEWPIRVGTVYKLQNKDNESSEVKVIAIRENGLVEWISKNQNYHCRYTFKSIDKNITELKYYEWVNKGRLEEPFTLEILEKLKQILEG